MTTKTTILKKEYIAEKEKIQFDCEANIKKLRLQKAKMLKKKALRLQKAKMLKNKTLRLQRAKMMKEQTLKKLCQKPTDCWADHQVK